MASEEHRSKALGIMETMFGLGMLAGPFAGMTKDYKEQTLDEQSGLT